MVMWDGLAKRSNVVFMFRVSKPNLYITKTLRLKLYTPIEYQITLTQNVGSKAEVLPCTNTPQGGGKARAASEAEKKKRGFRLGPVVVLQSEQCCWFCLKTTKNIWRSCPRWSLQVGQVTTAGCSSVRVQSRINPCLCDVWTRFSQLSWRSEEFFDSFCGRSEQLFHQSQAEALVCS